MTTDKLHNMVYVKSVVAQDYPEFFLVTYTAVAPVMGKAEPYENRDEYKAHETRPVAVHRVFQVHMGLN